MPLHPPFASPEGEGLEPRRGHQKRDAKNAPHISLDAGRVKARVIRTDEELMITRSTTRVLNLGSIRET